MPEQLDGEIVAMKVMFVHMVDRIMDNQIDSDFVLVMGAMMCQSSPLVTAKLGLTGSRQNPPKINSYSKIVQSMFPNGVESDKDQSMATKEKT